MSKQILGYFCALFVLISTSKTSFSQEYFGTFSQGPEGIFLTSVPRPLLELRQDFTYLDPNGMAWTAPKGITVDGASIPRELWSIVGSPFSGNYLHASVIHDYYCDQKTRTSHATHRAFYNGMRANGVPYFQATIMYYAVVAFGPDWTIEKRVKTFENCAGDGSKVECISTPQLASELTSARAIDLQDPTTLAIAQGKIAALAKNLKASDGRIFDVTSEGREAANLDKITAQAERMRTTLINKSYINSPDQLGVMATWDGTPLFEDENTHWDINQIPTFAVAPSLHDITQGIPNRPFEYYTIDRFEADDIQRQLILAPEIYEFNAVE